MRFDQNEMEYRENYWQSSEHKSEFRIFLRDIHNLDLGLWNDLGYWDDNYRPFSFFHGGKVISNVCVYSMDMMVLGERKSVAQISAVGTRSEYRGKGLSSELTKRAIKWADTKHDFYFLFADDEAVPFYRKRGFEPITESRSSYPLKGARSGGAKKLDPMLESDRDFIYNIVRRREPVSNRLGVFNEKLFMFHCLYFLAEYIYYIEASDLLVLYKRDNGRLVIFDIVGSSVPTFHEIYPHIAGESDRTVEFMFEDDRMNMDLSQKTGISENNGAHVFRNFPLEKNPVYFPFTARA